MGAKTVIGHAARGENYFKREKEIEDLWHRIERGAHILISAPRRVGKTSLLYYVHDNPKDSFEILFVDTESISDSNKFFKKLFKELLTILELRDKFSVKAKELAKDFFGKIKKAGTDGIEFEDNELVYFDLLTDLIRKLHAEDRKIILIIDEFAETVSGIKKKSGIDEAITFLACNRELRSILENKGKVQFIYAGSIGLESLVGKMSATKTINDLYCFKMRPLTPEEASELIIKITDGASFVMDAKLVDYLLKKIDYITHFYVQLIIDELDKICNDVVPKNATRKLIDRAFENAIENRNYFDNWHSRLRSVYDRDEYKFIKAVLDIAAGNGQIITAEIYNLVEGHNMQESYKHLINVLIDDGYINNNGDSRIYKFNSPILRMWWNKYVAN